MNQTQETPEQILKKDFPDLAEAMAAHCITTTVPDEPNGQPLELWVMPIGQVLSWMKIANKQAISQAKEEERKRIFTDLTKMLMHASTLEQLATGIRIYRSK